MKIFMPTLQREGPLCIFWWRCASGSLKPVSYTRPCSTSILPSYSRLGTKNPYPIPDLPPTRNSDLHTTDKLTLMHNTLLGSL